ncbi:hypothetical protein CTAYLR_008165 [Chrysophaeum taylorii]|uniref:Eukaryotic translation initiation factor 3 subunit 7 n=1 Tax=Chrysophaeum taylorii TaxID=2483200 RepID=A0AAD7U9Z4_9STRA|nr:hypothetical protein CTAYLR_008165 [Chrysophaeum taylorii]
MAESSSTSSTDFPMPVVFHNREGWGPKSTNLPSQFVDMPYAPFGKGDRLGRAADFTTSSFYSQKKNYRRDRDAEFRNEDFQYRYDAVEDQSFHLVDTAKAKTSKFNQGFKKPWQQGRGPRPYQGGYGRGSRNAPDPREQFQARGKRQGGGRGGPQGGPGSSMDRGRGRGRGRGYGPQGRRDGRQQRVDRQASVKVSADWVVLEEFDLSQLTKLSTRTPDAEDVAWAGELAQYNDAYDRCTTRTEKPLQRMENVEFYYVTTTDDPGIEKFMDEGVGNVYGTDAIFSLLMASPRSVYPWDVVVTKVDGNLVFDKRDTAAFDFLTVSETSHEPPQDPPQPYDDNEAERAKLAQDPKNLEINSPEKLSLEATMINQNFSQQILRTDIPREKLDLPNPFASEHQHDGVEAKPAAIAYRYRKFSLGEHTIVARTELHGIVIKRGEKHHMTAYALNEWDSRLSGGVDWRQKIDQQRGAVLATELKNNSCKLARWTAQSILAGADQMKLGYVSRLARANPYDHVILATQFYKPREFATQITLNVNNMWGIIKMLCDLFFSKPDGKYVIARDANRPIARIYSVPMNTFEDPDSDDDQNQADNDNDESSDDDI